MEKPVLFINACVRTDSRTERLAYRLLEKLEKPCVEVRLEEIAFPVADEAFLQRRDRLLSDGKFGDSMFDLARQFAAAEEIVIAAPYWDLSFPAALKQYLEQINVVGITFRYTEEGVPEETALRHHRRRKLRAGGVRLRVCESLGTGILRDPGCTADPCCGPGHRRCRCGGNHEGCGRIAPLKYQTVYSEEVRPWTRMSKN